MVEPSTIICQGWLMEQRTTRAGGCLMAAAILAGTVIGIAIGEPSLGVIGGAITAGLLALILWAVDRRR